MIARVEKTMSMSVAELDGGLDRFAGDDIGYVLAGGAGDAGRHAYTLEGPTGSVTIEAEILPPARLGGLLELPRMRVVIDMGAIADPAERRRFLALFDRAFQRGGG